MKIYDKRIIAAEMLEEAILKFKAAETDLDFIQCILLAGDSIDITTPLLSESQIKSSHEKFAENVIKLREYSLDRPLSENERKELFITSLRLRKQVYNSLKDAGKASKFSHDLDIETDFSKEAEMLLFAAIKNFEYLSIPPEFLIENGKNEFRLLIGQSDPLGTIPKYYSRPRRHK